MEFSVGIILGFLISTILLMTISILEAILRSKTLETPDPQQHADDSLQEFHDWIKLDPPTEENHPDLSAADRDQSMLIYIATLALIDQFRNDTNK